jgi:hypothetical protein
LRNSKKGGNCVVGKNQTPDSEEKVIKASKGKGEPDFGMGQHAVRFAVAEEQVMMT